MNIMVIGNGGRESALKWKLLESDRVDRIFSHEDLEGLKTIKDYCDFAKANNVDLTIVGSEELLVDGIVDAFKEEGLVIFGSDKHASMLEGSKAFAKNFMKKYGVKTPKYGMFNDFDDALKFLKSTMYPIVIKADGLAGGKGVFILDNFIEAKKTLGDLMCEEVLGDAGRTVIIEEYLKGVEASILSIYDGERIVPFVSAKDHKKIGEGETGLNTGGMGVIAPNPFVTEKVFEEFEKKILIPTKRGLKSEGFDFKGVIFFGLMITSNGVYLLEYNMRFGDPETQAVLPLMQTELLDVIQDSLRGELKEIKWKDRHSCCVVLSSSGYPLKYKTGFEINGLEDTQSVVFTAGAKRKDEVLYTSGGRVLGVVGIGESLDEAKERAYEDVGRISFEGMYYRKDIGC